MIRDPYEYRLVVKLILTASLPFIAVVFLYIKRWQHRWMKEFDFSPLIEEELQRLGLELVEIRNPTRHEAQNSPLPPPQGLRSFMTIRTLLLKQVYLKVEEYRIIRCKDRSGALHEVWVEVDADRGVMGSFRLRFGSHEPGALPPPLRVLCTGL